MAKGEFFLEVRCEEIPARMLQPAIRELATRVFEDLLAKGLTPAEVRTGFTPRRLILVLKGVPSREPDRQEKIVGPPVSVAFGPDGVPTAAAVGFAKKAGIAVDQIETVTTEKGLYAGATVDTAGRAAPEVLAQIVPAVLANLTWAKSMKWGHRTGPWVRPIHGIVALWEGEVVPFELFDVESGDVTLGHPVLSPRPFVVRGAADYSRKMARRRIDVDFESRGASLLRQMREAATQLGGTLVEDPQLLDKLAAICEIPGIVVGAFDGSYLALPREVLITSLRDHQSAFTVESAEMLLPCFLTVMDRPDDPKERVRAGNEWVVGARLDDARFFYGEDRKSSLAAKVSQLDNLTFHVALGSYADKTARIVELADFLCEHLGWREEREEARQAAQLLKVDLTTEMVKEFTSLQGIMGGIYAREDGQPEGVWQAIYDQYQPAGVDDPIPRGRAGLVTAMADRVDTLVGMFGLGLVPSGSRDPFGLRRAAQGLVRIALDGNLQVDYLSVAKRAIQLYADRLKIEESEVCTTLETFLNDRARHVLGLQGHGYDSIEAAVAVGSSDLPDLRRRIEALQRARERGEFLSVVLAAKRISNIVRNAGEHQLDESLLLEPAEVALYEASRRLEEKTVQAESAGEYDTAFEEIARLAEVLDRFFVEILVMDEDERLRGNRIALLQQIQEILSRTALLTEVVVDRTEHRERATSAD